MAGMKARLGQLTSQLEALKTKAGQQVKAEYHKQLDAWKAGAASVAHKLTELKAADEKWYVIKAELEKALHAIEAALGQGEPAKGAQGDSTPVAKPTAPPPSIVEKAPAGEAAEAATPASKSRQSA